jgi:hypothetical protein
MSTRSPCRAGHAVAMSATETANVERLLATNAGASMLPTSISVTRLLEARAPRQASACVCAVIAALMVQSCSAATARASAQH